MYETLKRIFYDPNLRQACLIVGVSSFYDS
jgi:hypothetical protein